MFCPKCREHWQILTRTAKTKESAPFTCPSCGVPLANDRIAAEFPAMDMSGRIGSQTLTVGQFMRETSDTVPHPPLDDEGVEVLVMGVRRGGFWKDLTARVRNISRQEGFIGYVAVAVTVLVLVVICVLNLPETSDVTSAASVPAASTEAPSALLPMAVDGWSRWPQVTEYKDSGDGHQLATTTYTHGATRAEVWIQWIPKAGSSAHMSWAKYLAAAPIVQGPPLGATVQARDLTIGNKSCHVWTVPDKRLGTTRIVPTSWLPSSQPVSVSWMSGQYVVTVAGSESAAMTLARTLVAKA